MWITSRNYIGQEIAVKHYKIISNKNVLEVGCPSGKLALSHDNYKKWYIVKQISLLLKYVKTYYFFYNIY